MTSQNKLSKSERDKRSWVLAALMMTMMLAAMDSTIVSTAIPHIVSDLGGFSKFSWVFSIYLLAQTVTIPLYGKFTDIFGRKKILIFGIILFLIGSATCATAWNIGSLIAFRGLQGLGAGSIMATVNTIAGDIYTLEERGKVQGYLSSIWGISAIVGPALGGALAEYAHWRWIFLINIPIGALSIYLLLRFFKENKQTVIPSIDYKGALLIMATLGLFFVFILEGGQSWSWTSVNSIALLAIVVVLALMTYKTERKSQNAIMPAWLWRNRTFAFTNLAMAGMGIVMMGPETFLPTFAQASLGLGAITSGFILASMSIGWPTASALSARVYMKIGFRETSIIGTIILLVATVGFLFIPHPQPIYLLVLNQILIGAGFGLLSTPALVGIQSLVGWQQRGVVTSSNIFARNLGQSLGAAIIGAIFNNSLMIQLKNAPASIPTDITDLIKTLHDPTLSLQSKEFLRLAINNSMHHIYWGMIIFSFLILIALISVPHISPKGDHIVKD